MQNAKNDPPRYGDGSGLDDGPLLPGKKPVRMKGHQVAEPEQVTEGQEDALGQDIDALDNLAHALLLPMPEKWMVEVNKFPESNRHSRWSDWREKPFSVYNEAVKLLSMLRYRYPDWKFRIARR